MGKTIKLKSTNENHKDWQAEIEINNDGEIEMINEIGGTYIYDALARTNLLKEHAPDAVAQYERGRRILMPEGITPSCMLTFFDDEAKGVTRVLQQWLQKPNPANDLPPDINIQALKDAFEATNADTFTFTFDSSKVEIKFNQRGGVESIIE